MADKIELMHRIFGKNRQMTFEDLKNGCLIRI